MTSKKTAAVAAAGVLALAGAGAGLAATGHGAVKHAPAAAAHAGGPAGDLATAATYIGITADALRADLQAGKTLAQVADATSGKSSAGLIAALVAADEATLQQRVTAFVNAAHPAGHGPGDDLAAAASYLGITTDVLLTDLQSGKTLAQVADATSGKSSAGLVDALVAAEKTELDAKVAAGTLTAAQETTIVGTLQQRITDLVNNTRPSRP